MLTYNLAYNEKVVKIMYELYIGLSMAIHSHIILNFDF